MELVRKERTGIDSSRSVDAAAHIIAGTWPSDYPVCTHGTSRGDGGGLEATYLVTREDPLPDDLATATACQ